MSPSSHIDTVYGAAELNDFLLTTSLLFLCDFLFLSLSSLISTFLSFQWIKFSSSHHMSSLRYIEHLSSNLNVTFSSLLLLFFTHTYSSPVMALHLILSHLIISCYISPYSIISSLSMYLLWQWVDPSWDLLNPFQQLSYRPCQSHHGDCIPRLRDDLSLSGTHPTPAKRFEKRESDDVE